MNYASKASRDLFNINCSLQIGAVVDSEGSARLYETLYLVDVDLVDYHLGVTALQKVKKYFHMTVMGDQMSPEFLEEFYKEYPAYFTRPTQLLLIVEPEEAAHFLKTGQLIDLRRK